MRITIATGIYPPDLGGPAKHAEAMKSFLESQRCKTSVVTFGPSRPGGVRGLSRAFPFGFRHGVYFLRCLFAALASDVVYAQDAAGVGLPALLSAKLLRRKFVVRVGGDLAWERVNERAKNPVSLREFYAGRRYLWQAPIYYCVTKLVLSLADAVIVPAVMLKEVYVRYYGIAPEKILHFPNPELIPEAPSQFADPEQDRLLFAGRFVAYKNLDLLLRAFDQARQKSGRGKLVLVGDGPERHRLLTLKDRLASKEFIEIRFPISREDLTALIRESGVCVGPALTEFNPNFILECLAVKKPVLISSENGLSVQLPNQWLFEARDEKGLAQKLEQMLTPDYYRDAVEKFKKIAPAPAWRETATGIFSVFSKLCGY